jgi:hypothetical protein
VLWATTTSSGVPQQSCQASFPTPYLPMGVLITYLCLCFLLSFVLPLCSDALFESRILSTCFPRAKLYTRHLLPITFCLLFELALRVVGMLRLFQVVLSNRVIGKLSHALLDIWDGYELEISWILDFGDKHDLFMLQLHLFKQRHRWVILPVFRRLTCVP